MRFFQFTPKYSGPKRAEPLIAKGSSVTLPGLRCDICGTTWTSTGPAIPLELPDDHPLRHRKTGPVPVVEFQRLREDVRKTLNLGDVELPPGTEFGLLRMLCKSSAIAAFEWPKYNAIIVRRDVVDVFVSNNVKGWTIAPVQIDAASPGVTVPELHRLCVVGTAGEAITKPPLYPTSQCEACGRTTYNNDLLRSVSLNDAVWDGSDIFRFDGALRGFIFVTDRLAGLMRDSGFDNYDLSTKEQFLATTNKFRR
jgi:hypothetical protein